MEANKELVKALEVGFVTLKILEGSFARICFVLLLPKSTQSNLSFRIFSENLVLLGARNCTSCV